MRERGNAGMREWGCGRGRSEAVMGTGCEWEDMMDSRSSAL
jgi:hypothetical protein